MPTIKNINVEGYCNYLNDFHKITVTYFKVDVLHDPHSYAKADSFTCTYLNECNVNDCPLYKIADQRTDW